MVGYGFPQVSDDADGVGSPARYRPYRCWSIDDRGRYFKANGANSSQNSNVDRQLWMLGVETDGGWSVDNVASRDNQLEVCRVCGGDLGLRRDVTGAVIRSRGEQVEYCSATCRRQVKNARDRAKRRVMRPKPQPKTFDLSGIYVAGIGRLDVSVAEWVRLSADNRESIERAMRCRPRPGLSLAERHRGSTTGAAERIARRYGSPGRVVDPVLPFSWDAVQVRWSLLHVRVAKPVGCLKQIDDNAWCIVESEHANH